MLGFVHLLAHIRIVHALRVNSDRVRAVIKLMDHPPLVQGEVQFLTLLPPVAVYWVKAISFELRRRTKVAGTNVHIELAMMSDRPRPALVTIRSVHQHRMTLVDAPCNLRVPSCAKDRRGPRVRDSPRAKSSGASEKHRSGSLTVSGPGMKNAHSVSSNRRSAPPKINAQNLNRESTSGKNGGRSVPSRRFSKSSIDDTRPVVETDLKKPRRRLVRVDARRREQPPRIRPASPGSSPAQRTANRGLCHHVQAEGSDLSRARTGPSCPPRPMALS